ncbi:MAG: hypothetical protein JNL67_16765 [Planctomycetaceae bacterium]|nr:hypothetical protein [Planctomycetaceae bacterium]
MNRSVSASNWPWHLKRQLPEQHHGKIWLARLEDWLALWTKVPIATFCRPLAEVETLDGVARAYPWVVVVLPDPRWAEELRDSGMETLLFASSRIGNWQERADLAPVVRHWLAQLGATRGHLVTGRGMTCRSMSIHASHVYGLGCWEWLPSETQIWSRWLEATLHTCREPNLSFYHARLLVTPSHGTLSSQPPVVDRLAFASARQLVILSLRKESQTWSLAQETLSNQTTTGRLHVLLPAKNNAEAKSLQEHRVVAQQLMTAGAIGWHLTPSPAEAELDTAMWPTSERSLETKNANGRRPVEWLSPGMSEGFLCHHTRATSRQWPEEVEGDFWWRWLMDGSNHCGPWDTLLRIACQQKLRAGRRLIPGQRPVVCFSGRCPRQTSELRTFRPHLRRWDYEPYGIAIRRAWLEQHGVRPVEYLETGQPKNHFQQIRYSKGAATSRVDWSLEQEYRWEGDLDLRIVPVEAMFYFTWTAEEARRLANYTPCLVKFLEPVTAETGNHDSLGEHLTESS